MTVVATFFNRLARAIPALVAKVGTILLLIFTVGMLAGYAMSIMGVTPFLFVIPIVAMFVMWYRLDEGVFLLLLLSLLVVFFPDIVNSLFSAIL